MPFVSKVLKVNLIDLATKVMLGLPVEKPHKSLFDLDYVGVKAPQFSFSRLAKADPVLGVDMSSTGEVGCLGEGFYEAILKAMFSVGFRIPQKAILLSTGPAKSKRNFLCRRALKDKGNKLYATRGTQKFLADAGVEARWPTGPMRKNRLTPSNHTRKGSGYGNQHTKRPQPDRTSERLLNPPQRCRFQYPSSYKLEGGQCLHYGLLQADRRGYR
jgi:hypothetical protein